MNALSHLYKHRFLLTVKEELIKMRDKRTRSNNPQRRGDYGTSHHGHCRCCRIRCKSIVPQAVSDAYAGLKKLLQNRYGGNADLTDAVDLVSQKPEAAPRRQMLEAALKEAGADKDQELHQLAQQLLAALKEHPGSKETVQQTINQNVSGKVNIISGTDQTNSGNLTINC